MEWNGRRDGLRPITAQPQFNWDEFHFTPLHFVSFIPFNWLFAAPAQSPLGLPRSSLIHQTPGPNPMRLIGIERAKNIITKKIKVNWCWVCLFACLLSLRSSGGWLPPLTPQRKRKANSTNSLRVGNTQSNQLLAFHAQPQLMDELFVAPLAYRLALGSLGRRWLIPFHCHS